RKDFVSSAADEISRLRRWACPEIGKLDVRAIQPKHVHAVLVAARDAGKARQTVVHLRQDIANVFDALKAEGVVSSNPAAGVELPLFKKTPTKTRAVLTDEELAIYLAWRHPNEKYRWA